ncbi:MAG: ABC transporter permease subunit [Butyrivibrio sp.]|nr:ABC transporter permease subunit [Butyrivibrio sp.]
MLNALKMDFYRFRKTKSLYIILAAAVAMCAFTIWSMYLMSSPAITESGIPLPDGFDALVPKTVDGYVDSFFQGNFVVLFTVIFAVIFCNTEHRGGFIKNIASVTSNRIGLVLSRTVVILAADILIHIVTSACVFIACFGIMGINEIVNPSGIALTILISIVMNLALGALSMMLFMLCRKIILPLISGIVYVLMGGTVYSLVDLIFNKLIGLSEFRVEKYTTLGNMLYYVNTSASGKDYIRAVLVSLIVLVISVIVSWQSLNRKDIK